MENKIKFNIIIYHCFVHNIVNDYNLATYTYLLFLFRFLMVNKKKILIINVLGLGDIARNTSILIPLRKKYNPCHITWLTGKAGFEMLENNPFIDEIVFYDENSLQERNQCHYQLIISPEQVPRIAAIANKMHADEKLGFGVDQSGHIVPFNPESHYAYQLGVDDHLKFKKNKRTYQEILFESVKLDYSKNEYCLPIQDLHRQAAAELWGRLGIKKEQTVVGLNIGYGIRFPNKMWSITSCISFVEKLAQRISCKIFLFGGKQESPKMVSIVQGCSRDLYLVDTSHSIPFFQALIGKCDIVISGDSLGMHLAIAEKCRVVALFGPTCGNEIEFYGRGEALISPIRCAPCYKWNCCLQPNCMDHISHERVIATIKKYLNIELPSCRRDDIDTSRT